MFRLAYVHCNGHMPAGFVAVALIMGYAPIEHVAIYEGKTGLGPDMLSVGISRCIVDTYHKFVINITNYVTNITNF